MEPGKISLCLRHLSWRFQNDNEGTGNYHLHRKSNYNRNPEKPLYTKRQNNWPIIPPTSRPTQILPVRFMGRCVWKYLPTESDMEGQFEDMFVILFAASITCRRLKIKLYYSCDVSFDLLINDQGHANYISNDFCVMW